MKYIKKLISAGLVISMLSTSILAGCSSENEEGETTVTNKTESDSAISNYTENKYKVANTSLNLASNFSAHDPSIFYDEASGKYYIFGSHMAQCVSDDLKTWKALGVQGYTNASVYGVLEEGLAGSFEWAGYKDSDCIDGYAVWAPDIIFNEHYVWEDGSKGAYMLYYSASSTSVRSCIGYAVSKNIEEGYKYVDTIIYSGFTNVEAYDEKSTHNKHVENTNVYEVYGTTNVSDLNQSYFSGDGYNSRSFPNAIDPSLFFDAEGKLWMTYGSWSGGLWIIEMDPATGQPIHDEEQSTTPDNYTDLYFGKRIAYGNGVSGEGPYIRYDSETGYYWLFTSIGWLASDGGYSMRMFRSENPDGPYVDAAGKAGTAGASNNTSVGIKIMGGYDLPSLMNGYLSPGHNSFLMKDGNYYLVYHTRFENSGEVHNVRVHQMFLNKDNWLCVMPFQYADETLSETGYKAADLDGIYNIVQHGTDINTTVKQSATFAFTENGDVINTNQANKPIGSWSVEEGTNYATIKILSTEYNGVICEMKDEAGNDVLVISAIADTNATLWAVMYK